MQGDMLGSALHRHRHSHPAFFGVFGVPDCFAGHAQGTLADEPQPEGPAPISGGPRQPGAALPGTRSRTGQTPHSLLMGWQETVKPAIVHACQMLRTVTAGLAGPATRLRLELSALVGEADANAILSNLSGTSGDLASLGPLLGLAQVAEGRLSRETYLERYGHRGPHEMELFAPGADDDPEWFEKQLAQFTQTAGGCGGAPGQAARRAGCRLEPFRIPFPGESPGYPASTGKCRDGGQKP